MAQSLNPSEIEYQNGWIAADPDSEEVNKTLDARIARNPTDAFACYMVAQRKTTCAEKAVELLSGAQGCVQGQGSYCEDVGPIFLMCALMELLPEAPTVIHCSDDNKNRVHCSVAGRYSSDIRIVELVKTKGFWKVIESKKAASK